MRECFENTKIHVFSVRVQRNTPKNTDCIQLSWGPFSHARRGFLAQKIQKKAAKEGFDWDQIDDVFNKLDEEIAEFKEAVLRGKDVDIQSEFWDILFTLVNIAKFKNIDAEEALRSTINKFIKIMSATLEKIQ